MSTSSSISFNEDTDGNTPLQQSRPSSPVAKTLEDEEQQEQHKTVDTSDAKPSSKNKKSSIIPNLLSSGKFPPPPHSPTNHHHNSRLDSMSPPNIIPSPTYNSNVSSPSLPPVPPTTPQLSINFADGAAARIGSDRSSSNIPALHPPLPVPAVSSHSSTTSPASYTLNNRSVSPPLVMPSNSSSSNKQTGSPSRMQPPNIPPSSPGLLPPQLNPSDAAHYNKLLNQELSKISQHEKNRISNLTKHEEANYTTIDEYKHALSRERRYSTSLSIELTQYKFLTRYTSCNIHNQDEIEEEARINTLIKNIDKMKTNMNEEKVRVVMELEREEERIINNLMCRLEEVKKEKADLEFQISNAKSSSSIGGTKVGGGSNRTQHGGGDTFVDEEMLIQRYERMNVDQNHRRLHGVVVDDTNNRQEDTVAAAAEQQEQPSTGLEEQQEEQPAGIDNVEINEIEEESEEEEEEEDNEDILGDVAHDPEMEEELNNLLKMKDSK